MSRLPSWLQRALLPAHLPSNLAIMRIILGAYACYFFLDWRRSYRHIARHSDEQFFRPIGLALPLQEPLHYVMHGIVYDATIVVGVLFTLGVLYRVSGPLFGLLALLTLTYRQSWGFIYHTENIMVVHALVFGFAPAAHRFSLDSLVGRRWSHPWLRRLIGPLGAAHEPSWKYGWPTQLALLITGVAYWVAGMAKLGRGGGLDWALEGHLLGHIGNNALRYHFLQSGAQPITYEVYAWPAAIIMALSVGSLLMELTAPVVIVHRHVALAFAPALFAFHWGIYMVMGIPFDYQLRGLAFVPFIRWDRLLLWLQARVTGSRVTPLGLH